jgi:hypothetical protein
VDALVSPPLEHEPLERHALEAEHRGRVPGQDVDLERRPALAQIAQVAHQVAGPRRVAGVVAAQEVDLAVELPSGHQDRPLGLPERVVDGAVEVAPVDQQAGSRRVDHRAAGLALDQDAPIRIGRAHAAPRANSATTGR